MSRRGVAMWNESVTIRPQVDGGAGVSGQNRVVAASSGRQGRRRPDPRAEGHVPPRARAPAPAADRAAVPTIEPVDFETRAIHDGQEPDPATGAIVVPIYQTSTFVQEEVGQHKGYDYARVTNPTPTALQIAPAPLESAEHGIAFSSGLGAP